MAKRVYGISKTTLLTKTVAHPKATLPVAKKLGPPGVFMADAVTAILEAKASAMEHDIDGFYIEALDVAESALRLVIRYGRTEVGEGRHK